MHEKLKKLAIEFSTARKALYEEITDFYTNGVKSLSQSQPFKLSAHLEDGYKATFKIHTLERALNPFNFKKVDTLQKPLTDEDFNFIIERLQSKGFKKEKEREHYTFRLC